MLLTGHGGPVWALAWAPDGDELASTGDDGRLLRWRVDLAPNALQARLRAASPVCLDARQRVQLLGEPEALADASARACQAREHHDAPRAVDRGEPLRTDRR